MRPIIADVHTHTIASGHAYGTIREMALLEDVAFPESLILNLDSERLLKFLLSDRCKSDINSSL